MSFSRRDIVKLGLATAGWACTHGAGSSSRPSKTGSKDATPSSPGAASPAKPSGNAVLDWSGIVADPISTGRPPASSQILHSMVSLAMYDAAMAIEGRFGPFAPTRGRAPRGADVQAAVATAAYRVARARLPAQAALLDEQYGAYVAALSPGQMNRDGVKVGEEAAAAILDLRAGDGFDTDTPWVQPTPGPGVFEPFPKAPPVDVKLKQVRPFTFKDPAQFRPAAPHALGSDGYTGDYEETRELGRKDSKRRTPAQTDLALFWSEHSYLHYNRNLISLAALLRLGVADAARLLALVHTAAADAILAGFEAKYFYLAWRPREAIHKADSDGNPRTDPDPTWEPLLVVNHPEYPSAHAFWSSALTDAISAHLGTSKVDWTVSTRKAAVPQLVKTERTYGDVKDLMRDVLDARVWSGLHWRESMAVGAELGRRVAQHVIAGYFRPST